MIENCKFLTFKVNFLCKKCSESLFFFILGANFLLMTLLTTSIFKPLYFLKRRPIFEDFYSTDLKTSTLFKGLVACLWPKGRPGRMCNRVRLKWGHTKLTAGLSYNDFSLLKNSGKRGREGRLMDSRTESD